MPKQGLEALDLIWMNYDALHQIENVECIETYPPQSSRVQLDEATGRLHGKDDRRRGSLRGLTGRL